MSRRVIVIGGGAAGMQAASTLRSQGFTPMIIEKNTNLGGKLCDWHHLFPSFTPASEVLGSLKEGLEGVDLMTGSEVESVGERGVKLTDGRTVEADAVIVASGFDVFRAELKEEYGYGIYDNVYTTVDIERMLNDGKVAMKDGGAPQRIAFLHCVGSRDEKVNQRHCSKVCCITGVKQAMELKELFPQSEVYNFYMDIRMFGPGYEEMYRRAQEEHNIHFIRGRISEASETIDRKVQIKAEDTLIGRPLKMTVDMLVLIVGMSAGGSNRVFASANPAIGLADSGFVQPRDMFAGNVCSGAPNIFYAGAVTAPKNVGESLNEGVAAAMRAAEYLKSL